MEDLAAHTLRLARLDAVVRAGKLDPNFEMGDPEDVQDLLALIADVPFDQLIHETVLFLNPTFGESSRLVGGADCDLIAGDMLVEVKTTKKPTMKGGDIDQLFGYLFLARNERITNHRDPRNPPARILLQPAPLPLDVQYSWRREGPREMMEAEDAFIRHAKSMRSDQIGQARA